MDGAQELITTPLRVFEFEWYQPVDGYHWEKTTAARTNHLKNRLEKGPYLVSKNGIYSGGLYRPLAEFPTLYLTFSKLKATKSRIQDFAGRYGHLGIENFITGREGVMEIGEGIEAWRIAIETMRSWVDYWDLIEKGNTKTLGRHLVWNRDGSAVKYRRTGKPEMFEHIVADSRQTYPSVFKQWRQFDVLEPAKFFLVEEVNEILRGLSITPRIRYICESQIHLAMVPHNLLSAMWLQFFQVLSGDKSIGVCQICKEPLDITGKRSDKVTHEKCRNRRKKATSRKLWKTVSIQIDQGSSVEDILSELFDRPTDNQRKRVLELYTKQKARL